MRVFFTSPWVPAEWIQAHGLESRGIWAAEQLSFASLPLEAGACAFASALLRLAETEPDSAFIFSSHCDQLRRAFDDVARAHAKRLFLFNLPATWQSPTACRLFSAEMERLARFLIALGGRRPVPEELAWRMGLYRAARAQLLGAASQLSGRAYAEAVARFHWDGSVALPEPAPGATSQVPSAGVPPAGAPGVSPGVEATHDLEASDAGCPAHAVPLALIGGPLPRADWALFDLVEQCGGQVVLNGTEAGERSLWSQAQGAPSLAARPPDSVAELGERLAREYLQHCVAVWQRPNSRLYDWLGPRLSSRGVRGILLWHFVGCDLWRAEAESLRAAFGLPLLALDAGDAASGARRNAGRVQAFLESLQ